MRKGLFVAMVSISLAAAVAALRIHRQLLERLGAWNAAGAAGAGFVALIVRRARPAVA